MIQRYKQFLRSTAMLVGLIVGVGIFGVPYVISKAGVAPAIFYFLILGSAMILIQLFYGEVNLRTKGKHRLVGFAEKYLGKWGKRLTGFVHVFGFYGGIIAYIIVGGEFLHMLLNSFLGGNILVYQIAIFVFVSIFIVAGLRLLSWVEVILTSLLLLVVLAILSVGFPNIRVENYKMLEFSYLFLPYGVILFSLGGSAAIPEIKEVLKRNLKLL
ncbi:MAG: aromatic amino acid transport family protein, partial [Patescibacteria group bacterium]|nr:aromatic amino acid transport family protein [Patescibacteria group bacterium]